MAYQAFYILILGYISSLRPNHIPPFSTLVVHNYSQFSEFTMFSDTSTPCSK